MSAVCLQFLFTYTRYLLSHLATLIQLQKVNELPEERSLLHSPFMMSLVSLCEIFQLEQVFQSSEVFHIDPKSAQVVADIPGNLISRGFFFKKNFHIEYFNFTSFSSSSPEKGLALDHDRHRGDEGVEQLEQR